MITNKSLFVASSWFLLYLLIKDARSFEHKVNEMSGKSLLITFKVTDLKICFVLLLTNKCIIFDVDHFLLLTTLITHLHVPMRKRMCALRRAEPDAVHTNHRSRTCCQTPITHIISTYEPSFVISIKYRLLLPDDGAYVIRNMVE